MKPVAPCLWFDTRGQEAAEFYVSLFPNSRIVSTLYYGPGMPKPEGSVLLVSFEINGQPFTALNGGPEPTFNEAVSFEIHCKDQDEVDRFWAAFLADGGQEGQCGWITDRFGVSWQVIPERFNELYASADVEAVRRMNEAMFTMNKLDLAALERACAGEG